MTRRNVVTGTIVGAALLITYALAFAGARERNSVEVVATGPGSIRIEGTGFAVSVEEDADALTFTVPLSPVDDDMLREAHELPAATLRIPRSELRVPGESRPAEGTAEGDFTLRGVSRPVIVHYTAVLTPAGTVRVHGSLQLDLRDFSLDALSVLGAPVASRVEVKATVTLRVPPRSVEGLNDPR